ncbi:hypothetical protein [Leptospira alstonii]|uniref:hypothetical protein n=1 Tax=Leptospira alstonii TaxID=28452 RepID=UPI000773A20C|nr:hypothetical protein [Leptospira alstonii]
MSKVFGLSFDLDTVAMTDAGKSKSEVSKIYQFEIPMFFLYIGFARHPQQSFYRSPFYDDQEVLTKTLKEALDQQNPDFRLWLKNMEIFILEPWSDVTALVRKSNGKNSNAVRNKSLKKGNSSKVNSQINSKNRKVGIGDNL